MASESVLINGDAYDHSCLRLTVFGMKIVGAKSIDYDDKLEIGDARGASQVSLGDTKGKYTASPTKMTILRTTGEELRQHIASQSRTGTSLGSVRGTIFVQFVHPEIGVQTVRCKKCRPTVPGTGSSKEGSDPLYEDWEFYTRFISRNNNTLYESDDPGAN